MWELDCEESRALKNWCFWTVVLEKTLWTTRRSNQSILKEISPGISLEGMLLKLKLQYFGHLMRRADSLEKTLMLGGTGGRRRRGRQRMRWLDGITDSMAVSLSELQSWWWTGRPGVLQFMGSQRVGHDWETELSHQGHAKENGNEDTTSQPPGWAKSKRMTSADEDGQKLEHSYTAGGNVRWCFFGKQSYSSSKG